MSGLRYSTLHAGRYTLTLGQFGRGGTRQMLRMLHARQVAGDTVEQFELTLPGKVHHVSGLVHAFTVGLTQHVCANQPLYINHSNSAYDIAHPRTAMVHLNGIVAGMPPDTDGYRTMGFARFSIQIGPARYALSGRMT